MSVWLLLLFWVAFTALLAFMHGALIPTLRKAPTWGESVVHDFALHKIGVVVWLLPLALAPSWLAVAIALLVRVSLFDVVCNYAACDDLFHVGQTAKTDKMVRKIAQHIGVSASVVNAVLKLISLLFLLGVLWINIV